MPSRVAIALLLLSLPAAARGQGPAVEANIDPAKAKEEMAAASKQLKEQVAELTVLQAKYHQPKADQAAIEKRFNEVQAEARAASEKLEAAAFAVVASDPKNAQAREVTGAVVAASLKRDDPKKALELATRLDQAGAAGEGVLMLAASAAMLTSDLDGCAAWLKKAAAAGVKPDKLAELEAAIATERPKVAAEMEKRAAEAKADDLPRVKITTTQGDIVVELFENEAPNTVANFISLVEKGFYDGTPFHRVIGGFMAQGGDPTGTGTSGPGYAIECEVGKPGARKHFLGTLSMAHAGPNTGGSQFFLTFQPTAHLDGRHTVFGRIIEGFDVLPKITRTEGEMASGAPPDKIVKAVVVRKREHPYEPKTLPDPRKKS